MKEIRRRRSSTKEAEATDLLIHTDGLLVQGPATQHFYVGTLGTNTDSESKNDESGENRYQASEREVQTRSSLVNLLPLIVDSSLIPDERASGEERTSAAQDHDTRAGTSGNNLILKFHFIRFHFSMYIGKSKN